MSAWLEAGGPWLPRMLGPDGWTCLGMHKGRILLASPTGQVGFAGPDAEPDATDEATLGAMLGEVRRVWGQPYAMVDSRLHPKTYKREWRLLGEAFLALERDRNWYGTEVEALAAAYAEAPEEKP